MENLTNDQKVSTARNTIEDGRYRAWEVTINNWTEEDRLSVENCGSKEWYINEEIGESGTPHLQCAIYFASVKSFKQMKQMFPRAHLSPAKKWLALKQYCCKTETAVSHSNSTIRDPLQGCEYKVWQQDLLNLMNTEPDDRSINFVYDPEGNKGKTSFIKHCLLTRHDSILVSGREKDMFMSISKMKFYPKVVFLNLTRSLEQYVSWSGIESIKDGLFISTKYEVGCVIMNHPHIIIMANFMPNLEAVSKDRWNVISI